MHAVEGSDAALKWIHHHGLLATRLSGIQTATRHSRKYEEKATDKFERKCNLGWYDL